MNVVIDTCSIYEDLKLIGANIRTLCETAKITGDVICMPQVVVEEAKNKYEERLLTAKSKIDKELSDLSRLTGKVHSTTFDKKYIEAELKIFKRQFDEQIIKLEIKVIQYSSISHEELVRKAVKKKKPFAESGKGYRDALIWENIKELVKPAKKLIEDPQVVLVTKNPKDFCEGDFKLHSDLKEELKQLGAPEDSVGVVENINLFVERYCKPKLKILNDIKAEFIQGKHKKFNVRGKVEKLVFSYLENRSFKSAEIGFPQEYENPSVSGIHEDYKFKIDEIRQLSEAEILIDCSVEVTCDFDVFIYKSDYYMMEDDEAPSIWDRNWNDHYFAAEKEKTINLKVSLTVDSAFYDIISNEIELIED